MFETRTATTPDFGRVCAVSSTGQCNAILR